MFGGLNRLLAAALVAGAASAAVLAGPPAALACNSGVSAVNVYKECAQSGGGSKPTSGVKPSRGATSTPHHFSGRTTKALSRAGKKDKNTLENLVSENGLRRQLQASHAAPTTEPSALGSAFDLGSGPTALLIALVATAALLLGGSGVRLWRHRHRA